MSLLIEVYSGDQYRSWDDAERSGGVYSFKSNWAGTHTEGAVQILEELYAAMRTVAECIDGGYDIFVRVKTDDPIAQTHLTKGSV